MRQRREPREAVDVNRVCSHLNWLFQDATKHMGKNTRGTELHGYQEDFAYFINDIQQGPPYFVSRSITLCNEFLERIAKEQAGKS